MQAGRIGPRAFGAGLASVLAVVAVSCGGDDGDAPGVSGSEADGSGSPLGDAATSTDGASTSEVSSSVDATPQGDATTIPDATLPDAADAAPAGPCVGSSGCAASTVCSQATGACVAKQGAICSPGADGGAPSLDGGGSACGGLLGCGAGACAYSSLELDTSTGEYVGRFGRCAEACDPCNDKCSAGTCVARVGGGGFCALAPLAAEGASCGSLGALNVCAAGRSCSLGPSGTGPATCVRVCRPNAPGARSLEGPNADESSDCAANELCRYAASPADGRVWRCDAVTAVGTGQACSAPLAKYCKFPDTCFGLTRTCTPTDCTVDPCPGAVACRTIDGNNVCVAPGTVGSLGRCVEQADCRAGLTCTFTLGAMRCA